MYELLQAGLLGNTIDNYFSLESWYQCPYYLKCISWGVRSLTPGGPCILNAKHKEVHEFIEKVTGPYSISMMVDRVATVTLWAEVYNGLVYGIEMPDTVNTNWRKAMPKEGVSYSLLQSKLLLQKHLNPNSLTDLYDLQERYPNHVIEFSALNKSIGRIPNRNAIVWEVRQY